MLCELCDLVFVDALGHHMLRHELADEEFNVVGKRGSVNRIDIGGLGFRRTVTDDEPLPERTIIRSEEDRDVVIIAADELQVAILD